MAKNDVRIVDFGGHNTIPTLTWQTEAAATAIYAGEPVKLKAAGSPYAIPLADGEPVVGTTTVVLGIAASDSTQTASADGTVEVYVPLPGVIYEANAKTASTVDSQSEINALCGDRVVFDLTSSTYTVDAAATDGATKGIYVLGGDAVKTVKFSMRDDATFLSA